MNDFIDIYKTYSNAELYKIIDSPVDYQPLAVEAAKTILASKQLSEKDITDARAEIELQRKEEERKNEKKKEIENKIKGFGTSLVDSLNPIQKTAPSAEKLIKLITIVFGALTLYELYNEFPTIIFMFTNSEAYWDISMMLYFFPLIIMLTSTLLFWKQKKSGWIFLMIFLVYSSLCMIFFFFESLNRQFLNGSFDSLFPQTSSATHLFSLIFFCGIISVICKEVVRNIYSISNKTMYTTIITTVIIIGSIILLFF